MVQIRGDIPVPPDKWKEFKSLAYKKAMEAKLISVNGAVENLMAEAILMYLTLASSNDPIVRALIASRGLNIARS
jgi:hypothetical protein